MVYLITPESAVNEPRFLFRAKAQRKKVIKVWFKSPKVENK
ncbi:MAG: hypothetical protein ACKPA8_19225 [Dolichospermum sp.]